MQNVGIIANTSKEAMPAVLQTLLAELNKAGLRPAVHSLLSPFTGQEKAAICSSLSELGEFSDVIISLGGDGTLLSSSVTARQYNKPILGINLGKLGFLAEFSGTEIRLLTQILTSGQFSIEERLVLEGETTGKNPMTLLAVNDIVIDKGGWPKMIDIELSFDDSYVTTFSADGLIIATPTGSTGYSLSSGGPLVTPGARVITLCPISAHSLTIRPLVVDSSVVIRVKADSLHEKLQINCDGQRVFEYAPPVEFTIKRSTQPLRLLRNPNLNYFEILRTKLFWGLDYRLMNYKNGDNSL